MSKNSIEGVKHSIQELAMGNYRSYPEEYNIDTPAAEAQVTSLAQGYWDSRDTKEIGRDERLGINLEDYQHWTKEAFEAFLQLSSEN